MARSEASAQSKEHFTVEDKESVDKIHFFLKAASGTQKFEPVKEKIRLTSWVIMIEILPLAILVPKKKVMSISLGLP